MSRKSLQFFRWLVTVLMVIIVPVQAVSATVAGLLGSRHSHRSLVAAAQQGDPMAGWRDFRRVQHDHLSAGDHAHAHALGLRHHHDLDDASVVKAKGADQEEQAAANAVQAGAGFVFIAARAFDDVPPPVETIGDGWMTLAPRSSGNPDPWRIERPPQLA